MKKFQTIKKLLLRNNENSYSNRNFNSNHKSCYDNVDKKPWCEECVPCCIIEGWTSGNNDVDAFVKDTIYNAGLQRESLEGYDYYPLFLEWVPFDRFKGIEQIGVGGFAKVYSATWIDGQAKYKRQEDGSWKKLVPDPIKFALKKLNGSQNMTVEYLNECRPELVLILARINHVICQTRDMSKTCPMKKKDFGFGQGHWT